MAAPAEASPRLTARVAGVFYLLTFIAGIASLLLGGRLVNYGDAAMTATNIGAHEALFRVGFAANVVATVCYVAVTLLLYDLFKPVSSSISLLAAFFSLVGCAIGGVVAILQLGPLIVLGGGRYLSVFTPEQLPALALVFLKLGAQANNVALVFFGTYCLLIGYLIFKSNLFPRLIGLLMALGGLGWLTSSFAAFLAPRLASSLSGYMMAPGIIGEAALTLWLLIARLNVSDSSVPGRINPA
jgi:Domain of unknown function (DUF4386)